MADASSVPSSGVDPRSGLSHDEIRAQLSRVLTHSEFEATERMRDFLRFIVDETLGGRAEHLKGYTIATEVFGRGEDFDAAADPIVRTQAGRLRRALERYYLVAGGHDPIRIDIPKGRYIPVFSKAASGPASPAGVSQSEADSVRTPAGPTVGILPLANLTGDPEQLYFVDGITEELECELSRYQDVTAIPLQDRAQSDGRGIDPQELGAETGARFLLGGSVRRDESGVKVTVQLTESATGRQLCVASYKVELDASGLIATEEEIARQAIAAIAGEYGIIAQRLSGESRKKPPAQLSTYDALLRYHHYLLVMTREAGERAFAALQQATEKEPEYGPAWSALANLFAHAWIFDRSNVESPLEIASEYARKGAAMEPHSQLARTVMAFVYLLEDELGNFRSEAETALALNPNSPNYTGTIGYLHAVAGDFDRGETLLKDAIALNPCHPRWFHHGLFVCYFQRRDYQKAYEEAVKVGLQVGFWDPAIRAAALAKLGRLPEARAAAREVQRVKPDFERRVPTILSRAVKSAAVSDDFLDALREAGLRIEETRLKKASGHHRA